MNFIGTFIVCLIVIVLLFGVCIGIGGGWAFFIIAALLAAGLIRSYLNISDRLERIEQHLGLTPSEEPEPKSFTEQLKESQNEETAP